MVPAVNQVEFHPHLFQRDLLQFCQQNNIQLEAYSSFGKGQLTRDRTIGEMAKKYNKTAAQVLLRWALQHKVAVIPKAATKEKIEENANVFDFELSEEDMVLLNAMNRDWHCTWDPTHVL